MFTGQEPIVIFTSGQLAVRTESPLSSARKSNTPCYLFGDGMYLHLRYADVKSADKLCGPFKKEKANV